MNLAMYGKKCEGLQTYLARLVHYLRYSCSQLFVKFIRIITQTFHGVCRAQRYAYIHQE